MKLGGLFYGLWQGIKSIGQNKMFSMAAVGTITACLFLFGIFYFIMGNFQYILANMEKNIGVSVFFEEGLSEEKIQEIGMQIEACKDVDSVRFVSGAEAWDEFSKELSEDGDSLAETFMDDNPLANSSSYEVYFNDISRQQEVVSYIEALQGVRQVYSSQTVAGSLDSFNMLTGYVSVTVIGILFAISIFLISMTVSMGISVRKQEIYIMRLVGATDLFIKIPFLVEGIVIGLLGAVLPLALLHILYGQVITYVTGNFPMLADWVRFLERDEVFSVLTPFSLSVGVGIGLLGSWFTVRKHLRYV